MSLTDDQIVAKNFKKYHEAILPYLNGSAHSGFTPIGTVISVMGTTAPLNYLACDGTIYNIADYTELAAYFNQQFGSSNFFGGDGTTTFAVPDLRGEFLRGTGTNSHANQGSGANVGVHQDGTILPRVAINNNNGVSVYSDGSLWENIANPDYNINGTKYFGTTGGVSTMPLSQIKATTRPTNTSVLYCIASKNIFMDAGSNYSTEEQVVGTWIDGKPIYQKTWSIGLSAYSDGPDHYIELLDVSTLGIKPIKCDGMVDKGTISIASGFRNETRHLSIGANSNRVFLYSNMSFATTDYAIFTLQYTKTTD